MNLSKKLSFLIISALYGVSMFFSYFVFPFWEYKYIGLINLLMLLGTTVFLLVQLYGYDYYLRSKLIFLSLIVSSGFLLLSFFPTLGDYSRIVYVVVTAIGLYMLLLAINVYTVSERRGDSIPLIQPAKVVTYLSIVAAVFLGSTIIYKIEWFINAPIYNLIIKIIIFIIYYILLFTYTSWVFTSEGGVGGESFNSEDMALLKRLQIFAVFCLVQFSIVLMFFPFEAFGRAVILGGSAYYLSNYIQNYIAHKINYKFLIEIIAALIFIYTLVYFT